jgi:hypothetical protein
MPDSNFPKVTMADEDFRSMLYGGGKDKTLRGRKWSCPADEMIAAYADGALRDVRKRWVEFHLAGCWRCRLLVAGVIKAQREMDLPLPPEELRWKAIGSVGRRSPFRRWIWAPAGALAVLALLAVATIVLRKPEQLIVQSPSPSVPLVAKSVPSAPLRTPVRDIERKSRSAELVPRVILPQADSVVRRERLDFGWKPVRHSRYYEVRLVTPDGDLVWEGQTERSELQPPSDLAVRNGSYFVWITAYLADGRVAKSPPVKFVVKR